MRDLPVKRYYSPQEVAEYFGNITADTIRELCRTGHIPGARQIGKKWFIPRSYLLGEQEQPEKKDEEKT